MTKPFKFADIDTSPGSPNWEIQAAETISQQLADLTALLAPKDKPHPAPSKRRAGRKD